MGNQMTGDYQQVIISSSVEVSANNLINSDLILPLYGFIDKIYSTPLLWDVGDKGRDSSFQEEV